jgi:hypothetical protein
MAISPELAAEEARMLREVVWESALAQAIQEENRSEEDIKQDGKTAKWKVDLALKVRQKSGASVTWLAKRMELEPADTARCQISLAKKRRTNA